MEKVMFFVFLFVLASCTRSLTTDERQQIRGKMKDSEIKRITEGEILEASAEWGNKIFTEHKNHLLLLADSTLHLDEAEVFILNKNSATRKAEKEILQAYESTPLTESLQNVQKEGTDTLLFTKPIQANGTWNVVAIRFLKRDVVRRY